MHEYKRGLRSGIPIGLGYLSVSFTFGIMAVSLGLHTWQAVLISFLTVTSAGQFSGIKTMMLPGHYMEMFISQFTINIRYSFMGISLSQKTSDRFRGFWRTLLGFFMTDEIFAVASNEPVVGIRFFAGLSTIPWAGWTLGTFLGAVSGSLLPHRLLSALSLAIYGMFVAIIVPEMKKSRPVLLVVFLSAALSCLFYFTPVLSRIPSGFTVSIVAVSAALAGALFFPIAETETGEGQAEPTAKNEMKAPAELTEKIGSKAPAETTEKIGSKVPAVTTENAENTGGQAAMIRGSKNSTIIKGGPING